MLIRGLAILALVAALAAAWLVWEVRSFAVTPLTVPSEGLAYTVDPGTPLRRVAEDLAAQGAVKRAPYLRLLARWREQAQSIKAGEYLIAPGTTPEGLLDQLVAGRVVQHALTVVEGWTFRDLLVAVAAHQALDHTLDGLSDEAIMQRLGYPGEHPEGRFFPETYHFPRGTTDLDFLRRAYETMDRLLASAWTDRSVEAVVQTPREALILASIVERETGLGAERAEIAGVFSRRLRKGMLLQTDPTVIYGMGEGFDGNLHKRDLERDTPYNTYTRAGLPPTPICLPGADAIHAALHPASGNSLYFVARGDGSHAFSATLAEHNDAVAKYQLRRKASRK